MGDRLNHDKGDMKLINHAAQAVLVLDLTYRLDLVNFIRGVHGHFVSSYVNQYILDTRWCKREVGC